MRNIIKADLYRIFRGKGAYIVFTVLLAIIALGVATGGTMNTGINYESVAMMEGMDDIDDADLDTLMAEMFRRPTGSEAPFKAMSMTDSILYLLLPLLMFITVADFSSSATKNILSCGVSRYKYYSAKLILSCVGCIILMTVYVLIFTLAATTISGFGGAFNGEFISQVLEIFLPQLLLCLAVTCVGNLFVFLFRSGGAVIGAYIVFNLVPAIVIFALTFADKWFEKLYDYELNMNISKLAFPEVLADGDITRALILGSVYIVVTVIGGYAIFRKAEVK